MKQYCRYCASLINGDALYCDKKDIVMTDKQIKRVNSCKDYRYCGFDEDGFEHKMKEYKRKNYKNIISLFE